jgi:hypothetical protein
MWVRLSRWYSHSWRPANIKEKMRLIDTIFARSSWINNKSKIKVLWCVCVSVCVCACGIVCCVSPAWQRSRVPRADVRSVAGSSARRSAVWPAAIACDRITKQQQHEQQRQTKENQRKKSNKTKNNKKWFYFLLLLLLLYSPWRRPFLWKNNIFFFLYIKQQFTTNITIFISFVCFYFPWPFILLAILI